MKQLNLTKPFGGEIQPISFKPAALFDLYFRGFKDYVKLDIMNLSATEAKSYISYRSEKIPTSIELEALLNTNNKGKL